MTVATAICLTVGATFVEKTATATAESTASYSTFVMEKGAAVRLQNGSNGLRFSAEISQDEYDGLLAAGAKFGVLIVANDLIGGDASLMAESNISFDGQGKASFKDTPSRAILQVYNAKCDNIDEDENIEISGSVVNFKTGNLTRPYVGLAYVGIPVAADTSESATEYEYHFASWRDGDMANTTRCMYYIAQRAIEENAEGASSLQTEYIDKSPLTGNAYSYTVVHHYWDGETETTETEKQSGLLNEQVTAVEKAKDGYAFDETSTGTLNAGLVYAAGLQTLHIYYKKTSTGIVDVEDIHTNENASEEYFDGALDFVENEDGSVGLETTEDSSSFEFTIKYIMSLQSLGYTSITITDIEFSVHTPYFYVYNYWGKRQYVSGTSVTLDISRTLRQNADGSYQYYDTSTGAWTNVSWHSGIIYVEGDGYSTSHDTESAFYFATTKTTRAWSMSSITYNK